jgi:hypothetical protein
VFCLCRSGKTAIGDFAPITTRLTTYGPEANAALDQAIALLLARKKQAVQDLDVDMRRGLGGMSMSRSVNDAAKRIFQPDLERRVALQLGLVMEQARETRAKKTSQNSSDESAHKAPN